ncbi:MAG: hypothetical protein AB9842_09880 [Bacteroidales bacterium]
MKGSIYLFIILLFWTGSNYSTAQPLPIVQEKQSREGFETAQSLYDLKAYSDALPLFRRLLLEDPDNSNLNFLAGDCMMNMPSYEKEALPYMQKAIKNVVVDYENLPMQRKAPVFAFEKLGDLLYQDYNFEQALISYRSFKAYLDSKKDKNLYDRVERKIEIANRAKLLVDNPLKLTLTELPFVNVISFNDYSAKMSSDGNSIYFTRERLSTTGNPGTSDIYYMRKTEGKWSRPVRMPFINTEDDDIFCWISDDESRMILCSNHEGDYRLFFTERKGKSQWTLPEPFNANINSKAEEFFGCISADGKYLYFVSNRKGGYGGKDIYRSARNLANDWGEAENLGPKVNSAFDEDGLYISRDGKTLYFSSRGFTTMGGYDIFYSSMSSSDTWTEAVNAGYPLNTVGDDLYYNRSYQGKPGYFVSRSRTDREEYSISVLNDSESATSLSEIKSKETAKEKPKLKLVPKTLKY